MPTTIEDPHQRVPILTWLPPADIEPGALEQLRAAANHPEAADHVAVMPDCHVGFGITIGSVFPTEDAIVPGAVGVDIGCGMSAVATPLRFTGKRAKAAFWQDWADRVRERVPTGFATHRSRQRWDGLSSPLRARALQPVANDKAAVQVGTLGGGNHFLEVQADEDDRIWVMVHSGSRHTGLRIAEHYADLAQGLAAKRGLELPQGLWSLPLDDETADDYWHDMEWATAFALESRYRMVEAMLDALRVAPDEVGGRDAIVNIHHNFARLEEYGGRTLVVHRKGATSARAGETGIIPGSMGTPSFIVRGKGNPDAFASCSHGAGRRMGRKQARRSIAEADFAKSLAGTFSRAAAGYLDEAPGAYKDIDRVMALQEDLVEIVHRLRPILTVKGDSRARED